MTRFRPLTLPVVGGVVVSVLVGASQFAAAPSASADTCDSQQIYVATNGSLSNNGQTLSAPIPLTSTSIAARITYALSMGKQPVVNIRAGTYYLDSALELTAYQSGLSAACPTTIRAYPGDTGDVVISGGRTIASSLWSASGSTYTASLSSLGLKPFHELYVNGTNIALVKSGPYTGTSQSSAGVTATTGDMPAAASYVGDNDIELWWYGSTIWRNHHIPVSSVTGTSPTTFNVTTPVYGYALTNDFTGGWPTAAHSFYVRNSVYDLTNSTAAAFQVAFNGADTAATTVRAKNLSAAPTSSTTTVVAPQLDTLLKVGPDPSSEPVQNVAVSGLTFSHTSWQDAVVSGTTASQSEFYSVKGGNGAHTDATTQPPGAVEVEGASNITFDDNTFTHLGAAGVVVESSDDVSVTASTITDVAGSGIIVGSFADNFIDTADEAVVTDMKIHNNTISSIGTEYLSAAGITAFYSDGLDVQHNTISNVPWAGITLGWNGWQTPERDSTTSRNTFVGYNKIEKYTQVLYDTAAIYTLGQQPNTEIAYNYLLDGGHNMAAIYTDEGSAYLYFHDNVIVDAPYASGCQLWLFMHGSTMQDMVFTNNSVYSTTGRTVCKVAPGQRNIYSGNLEASNATYSTSSLATMAAAGVGDESDIVVAKSCEAADVACGKNATFVYRGNLDYGSGANKPQNAISGISGLVSTSAEDGSAYVVDLLDGYDLGSVEFSGYDISNTTLEYDIDVSRDGVDWSTVAHGSRSSTDGPDEFSAYTFDTRYVRVMPVNNGSIGQLQVEEFKVTADSDPTMTAPTAAVVSATGISNTNLKLWLKADAGVSSAGDDYVSTWADQSGNGNNAVLPAAYSTTAPWANSSSQVSKKPRLIANVVNGRPAVRFDGFDDSLTAPVTGSFSSFTVAVALRPYDLRQIFKAGGWTQFAMHGDGLTGGMFAGTDVSTRLTPTTTGANVLEPGTWVDLIFTYDGPTSTGKLYKNGVLLASKTGMTAPATWTAFSLGDNVDMLWKHDGTPNHADIGEVLVYNSAADSARVAVLESYLSKRWKQNVPVGTFTISNKQSGLYVAGDATERDDQDVFNIATMQSLDATKPQRWNIYDIGDGYY
jgi:hypothetical protein